MAYSAISLTPWIVEYGGARIINNTYKPTNGDGDWGVSEFLQLDATAGTLTKVANAGDYVNGGIMGFSMQSFDDSDSAAHGVFVPVLKPAVDTVFAMQLQGGSAPDATDIGDLRDLVRASLAGATTTAQYGFYSCHTTTSVDVLMIDNIWSLVFDQDTSADEAGIYGIVYCHIIQTILDAPAT